MQLFKTKRLNFFINHLFISLFIVCLVVAVVLCLWYPAPLYKAAGVTQIFLMLLVIDIVLGPLLVLLVYKKEKKTLKFDIGVIIIIQILALTYGIFNIEKGRPVWLVYSIDRFELIRKNELIQENLKEAQLQFQKTSWLKPQFVAVEFSKDKKQRENDMFAEVFSGISIAQKPERYVDFSYARPQIQQRALPFKELESYNSKAEVQKTLAKYPNANAWLPLKANAIDMVVLINKDTTEIIKIVDLRPWK